MLTDTIVEGEFELKEEEPWYDKQDLEHDLQLAAELGKSLLERNRELEQGLQQMYSTNQEQLQEIEHLTKQVELLRQVNDQHAKVYEQLDVSARELEQNNRKLVQENRAAQQKIQGLAETVELLQTQVDELQRQVEELKLSPPHRKRAAPHSSQSASCLQELQDSLSVDDSADEPSAGVQPSESWWREEERASLQQSLRNLQTQFAAERAQRAEAEREAELLVMENAVLEQEVGRMEVCQARVAELEVEVEELRLLWKSEASSRAARSEVVHGLLPFSRLLAGGGHVDGDGEVAKSPAPPMGWDSQGLLPLDPDPSVRIYDHECSCVRRAEVVKYRGISLLSEVDAQYSALQAKYDALLQHCHLWPQGEARDVHSHRSVQTAAGCRDAARAVALDFEDDFHQPEYKELFREIFSRIQKTKEDLIENRVGP
ncbi:cerebellar degeneration-related protein 2-like [Nelusetta ayraudi]|uniref:cerebellar degeneration-related protein 2-like n=1 Tax=Nelusetta ayraudi TaxID=303726 RepID=UPI003F6EA1AE